MSNDSNPFDEVKQKVDLAEYLQSHLGVEFLPGGGSSLKAYCPFHDENTASFHIKPSSSGEHWTWTCFGACDRHSETVIDAAMIHEELLTPLEAVEYLDDLYSLGIDLNNPHYKEFKERVERAKKDVSRVKEEMASESKQAKQARAYLKNRGFTDETIDFFELAVDSSRTKAGRIAIPIREKGTHEVGVVTRAMFDSFKCASCKKDVSVQKDLIPRQSRWKKLTHRGEDPGYDPKACPHCEAPPKEARIAWLFGQSPKYDNPKASDGYEKARILYNEHNARKALGKDESLGYFLAEGYTDVWACWQSGQKACSSYNGASLSDWQSEEVTRLALHANKPVILLPDIGDSSGAGDTGLLKNLAILRDQKVSPEVQVVHSYGMRDPDENGEVKPINDFSELLELRGEEEAARVLDENRWSAAEYEIRTIVAAKNPKTGEPADSQPRQMEMVAEVLARVEHKLSLDHLAEHLAEVWGIGDSHRVRTWMESQVSVASDFDNQALMSDTREAQEAFQEYAKEHDPIPLGYDKLDACMPGGGVGLKQIMLCLGKSGTGKTMWALQSLGNIARAKGAPSLFLSLEQGKDQLIVRMTQQTLGVRRDEAERILADEKEGKIDPRMEELHELYENLVIFDGLPPDDSPMPRVTPGRIKEVITEANLTRVKNPLKIVVIDHLGLVQAPMDDPTVPKKVKEDTGARAGWAVEQLFGIAKSTNTTIIILGQLPKAIPAGVEFSKDAGYGGSEQTNFADFILCFWRPEQDESLPQEKRDEQAGIYNIKLAKNRHGMEVTGSYIWDMATLRILQPKWANADRVTTTEQAEIDKLPVGEEGDPDLGPEGLPKSPAEIDPSLVTGGEPPRDLNLLMKMSRSESGEDEEDDEYDWFTQ